MNQKVTFILCADDFGLNHAVDRAIITLVEQQRINAVSCMAVGRHFSHDQEALSHAIKTGPVPIQVGLHVTLTQYHPLIECNESAPANKLPNLSTFMARSRFGLIKQHTIRNEIRAQYARFVEVFGCKPDFIDGHQHVHLLPVVREEVIALLHDELSPDAWIRNCYVPLSDLRQLRHARSKAFIVALLARHFSIDSQSQLFTGNSRFFGINNFSNKENYRHLMQHWMQLIAQSSDLSLLACHPGLAESSPDPSDPIANVASTNMPI